MSGEIVPCTDLCAELSFRDAEDCLANGFPAAQCVAEALEFLREDCARNICGVDDLAPTCLTICESVRRPTLEACHINGGFTESCRELARIEVVSCLDVLCEVDIPSLPCKLACAARANEIMNDCVPAGGLCEARAIAAAEATASCIEAECPMMPPCDDTCVKAVYPDRPNDAKFRPTDAGRQAPFDPTGRGPIELLTIEIGGWAPNARPLERIEDAFDGAHALGADLLRIDIVLRGLVNPPGPLGTPLHDPYRYGPNPVYGFVELDMDNNVDTGGELDAPEFRYLSNVVRFGGRSGRPEFRQRELTQSADFDRNFSTAPFVERHGEEFHVALLGNHVSQIQVLEGNPDRVFDAGESWLILGRHFHRAHGFEPFSFVTGGDVAGEYAPIHPMLFTHDPKRRLTTIAIVFPITQLGSALLRGEPEEPINCDPTDQASVLEALIDLRDSADFLVKIAPTGLPEEQLIVGWSDTNPTAYLDPRAWSLTALLGTSFAPPGPSDAFFVWSDVYPDPALGDVDGSGYRGMHDALRIAEWTVANDFRDGVLDLSAPVPGFAARFSVFDVDYDGVVELRDAVLSSGDSDRDGDADLRDFARLQLCFGQESPEMPCTPLDLDRNLDINGDDVGRFQWFMSGPDPQ